MANPISHRDTYKQALQSKDEQIALTEKAWFAAAAASALLDQDPEAMRGILACCSDLSALADRFDTTGKPGDRWRALGDVLALALESGKPLQQLRLVLPSTVGGLLMKHIKDRPGITPTELADRCVKNKSHIANEIKKLENAGLIYRFKRGRTHELFLSALGKETLDSVAPMKIVAQPRSTPEFPYADTERLERLSAPGEPKLPFCRAA